MGQYELQQRSVGGSAQLDSSRRRQGGARIDADLFCLIGGKNFSILEVNPVARIDASDYGIDVPCAIIKHAKELCIE